ncbi:DAN Replication protein, partial [Phytophthora megakarya]
FVCRIISRAPIREHYSLRGAGRLCEIYVTDSHGDYIRLTIFNDAIDKFHTALVPGTTHYFSAGRIKLAAFGSTTATYEVTFGTDVDIRPVTDGQSISIDPSLKFTTFDKLEKLSAGDSITLTGIVHATGPMKRILTKKKGSEKREFALVDDTGFKVICPSWGLLARESGSGFIGQSLIVIGAQISDYNGSRSVNIGVNAIVLYEPAMACSDRLRDWYASLQPNQNFTIVG